MSKSKKTASIEQLAGMSFEPFVQWDRSHLNKLNARLDDICISLRIAMRLVTMTKSELVERAERLFSGGDLDESPGKLIADRLRSLLGDLKGMSAMANAADIRLHVALAASLEREQHRGDAA
jgi:hypothetical protein